MSDLSPDSLVVYCADIGSVANGRFAWARASVRPNSRVSTGTDIRCLVTQVAQDLNSGRKVALGFECPLWVPVSCDPNRLARRRCGERNRAWAAAAGATSLATGLTETAWILSGIRKASPHVEAYLDWPRFAAAKHGLFLWEAFVTGGNKSGSSDEEDAAAAVCAFIKATKGRCLTSDVTSPHKVRSLIGAALLWAGWSNDIQLLRTRGVVIRPEPVSRDASG